MPARGQRGERALFLVFRRVGGVTRLGILGETVGNLFTDSAKVLLGADPLGAGHEEAVDWGTAIGTVGGIRVWVGYTGIECSPQTVPMNRQVGLRLDDRRHELCNRGATCADPSECASGTCTPGACTYGAAEQAVNAITHDFFGATVNTSV